MNVFSYFRMGLATGLVDKQALISWADSEIERQLIPRPEIIELSLSMNRSCSEILWLLNSYEGGAGPDHDLPLKLLLARAGMLLERDPGRAQEIVMGLRLLNEEAHPDKHLRVKLSDLDTALEMVNRGDIPVNDLVDRLAAFLSDYAVYADDARQLQRLE